MKWRVGGGRTGGLLEYIDARFCLVRTTYVSGITAINAVSLVCFRLNPIHFATYVATLPPLLISVIGPLPNPPSNEKNSVVLLLFIIGVIKFVVIL